MGIGDWGLGIGDWGLGVWAQAPTPKPQTPKPQTQKFVGKNFFLKFLKKYFFILNYLN